MKKKLMVLVMMAALVLSVPAFALDYDFFGNLRYHNDVLSWTVTTDGVAPVTVFTSSWDEGNFDPMLAVWNAATGAYIYQQDDGHNVGSTMSNGVPYSHGNWDTYYSLNLGAGSYILSLATYYNWANGLNWSAPGFSYALETPIAVASWDQPSNGRRGTYYAAHFLGASEVIQDPDQVPEPATMLLLGLGLMGLAGYRRMKK